MEVETEGTFVTVQYITSLVALRYWAKHANAPITLIEFLNRNYLALILAPTKQTRRSLVPVRKIFFYILHQGTRQNTALFKKWGGGTFRALRLYIETQKSSYLYPRHKVIYGE
jgi:hypothetical protein